MKVINHLGDEIMKVFRVERKFASGECTRRTKRIGRAGITVCMGKEYAEVPMSKGIRLEALSDRSLCAHRMMEKQQTAPSI